jgi:hypothetical protein
MRLQLKIGVGITGKAAGGQSVNNAWYGLKFRDTFTVADGVYTFNGLEYERTGLAAGYDQGLDKVPEKRLTVHNKLRRCVVGYDGKVKYYLDHRNSMWQAGSWRQQSVDNAEGIVTEVLDNYGVVIDDKQVGNYEVKVNTKPDPKKIGCVMNIFDGKGASWYGVIIGISSDQSAYILSHPHIDGFGEVAEACEAYYMIGDAILGGQDGNVMVEIPSFWHKWSYEPDPENPDDLEGRAYYGWQHHQISLREIPGGNFYPKRYVGAFEGVLADEDNNPQDGWYGAWDEAASTWEGATVTPVPPNYKILSVAGYYGKTNISLTNYRTASESVGEGYHQYDATTNFIIQLLMIIELGHMQTQIELGSGINNISGADWTPYNGYRTIRKTGDTISAGNGTRDLTKDNQYIQIASNKYNIFSLSYRGIEQPYGHIFKWVDGIVFSGDGGIVTAYAHKCIDGGVAAPKQYKSHLSPAAAEGDANYIKLPAIESSDLAIVNVSRYWKSPSPHLLPNDDAKSRPIDAYTHDWFNQSGNGMRAFAMSGGANHGRYVGAFCVNTAWGLGTSNSTIGGRLCKN